MRVLCHCFIWRRLKSYFVTLKGKFEGPKMSTLSSKTFKLSLLQQDPDAPRRAVRRVVINADVLKASKISTGDLVAVTGSENVRHSFREIIDSLLCF